MCTRVLSRGPDALSFCCVGSPLRAAPAFLCCASSLLLVSISPRPSFGVQRPPLSHAPIVLLVLLRKPADWLMISGVKARDLGQWRAALPEMLVESILHWGSVKGFTTAAAHGAYVWKVRARKLLPHRRHTEEITNSRNIAAARSHTCRRIQSDKQRISHKVRRLVHCISFLL